MRKLVLLTFVAAAVALPLQARQKNESYISYDDGGTIVRQGDDGREVDGRVNLPVFPGDEVITNRRGRAEVRLADGNVVGIDRATAIRFRSVLDSYDSESNDTIAELRYGKVAVYRAGDASESFRLDTPSASYFAGQQASFSVDSDRGRDRLSVFQGTIDVRTPTRTSRVRSGESANIDERGLYGLVSDDYPDDFENWFLRRAERYGGASSRYLDRSLAYYDDDLASHGSWTFVSGFGWGWRPYVAVGWRPYYYGSWTYSRGGCLTWVSYEPWGWVPYHYGRWAWDLTYGWFWLPGAAYAPAWVYWWYSPGYIGWAPAGWYDCYRPYYSWAYQPYARAGIDFGFGFYGRVRVHDVDLRPWTFIDSNTILSTRADRAAVSTDIVRGRLIREHGGGFATISGTPARFTKNELRDPASAVNTIYRRGLTGGGGGAGGGASTPDMTPFFRRDADLPGSIRDRIVRTRPVEGGQASSRVSGGSGSVAPIGSGSVAPIGRGSVAPIGGGSVAPIDSGRVNRDPSGGVSRDTGGSRGSDTPRDSGGRINRGNQTPNNRERERVNRDSGSTPDTNWRGGSRNRIVAPAAPEPTPRATNPPPGATPDEWRGRVMHEQPGTRDTTPPAEPEPSRSRSVRGSDRASDVPRRIIEGIGGARIYRGGEGRESSPPPRATESRPPARESSPPPRATESRPPARESSPPPRATESRPSSRESSPPPQHRDSGGSRDSGSSRGGGGRIQRNKG